MCMRVLYTVIVQSLLWWHNWLLAALSVLLLAERWKYCERKLTSASCSVCTKVTQCCNMWAGIHFGSGKLTQAISTAPMLLNPCKYK